MSDYKRHYFRRFVDLCEVNETPLSELPDQAQALTLIRTFQENGEVLKATEGKHLSQVIELLLKESGTKTDSFGVASKCQKLINLWLTEQFRDLPIDEPIVATPLVPACASPNHHVEMIFHCEARFASDRDSEKRTVVRRHSPTEADCPRVSHCKKRRVGYSQGYARIEPYAELKWSEWSLLELFEVAGISHAILEKVFEARQGEGDEVVNRLAGEINRLNEIRSRCKCRECGERLIFSKQYSVKDAVYRATVTNPCSTDGCSGPSVYLSHCRGCTATIDSRESVFKDKDNFYICIACASGNDLEKAGEFCPKCGDRNSLRGNYRKKRCSKPDCDHRVELPFRAMRSKFSTRQESDFEAKSNWPN